MYNTLMADDLPNGPILRTPVQTESSWQFHPEETNPTSNVPNAASAPHNSVSWTASEFIAHQKSAGWYGLLMLAALATAGVVYLFTRDFVSTAVVIIVATVFAIIAGRKPRELEYRVDNHGIKIGEKHYPYSTFRSFSVVEEDSLEAIWLMPLKRFMPIITIYFEPADGEKIINTLSEYLPVEHRQPDPVDRLMSRIRF